MVETGKNIAKAKALLAKGEVVAIPTETVYGLAVNALDVDAVIRIFKIKERPYFDPLIVHVASIDQAHQYVVSFPPKAKKLASQYWPGPLTLVLEKKNTIPDIVTSGLDTVGIRCPKHPLTHTLLSQLSFPLAAPSANPFGYVSPTTPNHVKEHLGAKIPYILDGGPCIIGIESTIIGFDGHAPILYRMGGISQEEIESVIGPIQAKLDHASHPKAPGAMESHYAPNKKVVLGELNSLPEKHGIREVGILRFCSTASSIHTNNTIILSPSGNLEEAARNLFAALRQLDQMNIHTIIAERVPNTGIGKAINNRLEKAAFEYKKPAAY